MLNANVEGPHQQTEGLTMAELSIGEMQAQLAKLMAERDELQKANSDLLKAKTLNRGLTCSFNAMGIPNAAGIPGKGNVQVNGLGKFPTTQYPEQWIRLLEFGYDVLVTIEKHHGELAYKTTPWIMLKSRVDKLKSMFELQSDVESGKAVVMYDTPSGISTDPNDKPELSIPTDRQAINE